MVSLETLENEIRKVSSETYSCPHCKAQNEPLIDNCISCKKKTHRTRMLSILLKKHKELKEGKKPGIMDTVKQWFGV